MKRLRYQKRACGLHRRAPVSGALLFGTIEVCVMGLRARAEVPQGVTEINMFMDMNRRAPDFGACGLASAAREGTGRPAV